MSHVVDPTTGLGALKLGLGTAERAVTCPAWCREHDQDVYEIGDELHVGELLNVRAVLHDDDPYATVEESIMIVALNQRDGQPVNVVISDATGRVESRLLLEEAVELHEALADVIAQGRRAEVETSTQRPNLPRTLHDER
jgi:hypothetical protein